MILISGCLWGTLGLFVRRLNEYNVNSMSVVFLRAVLTSAFLFVITVMRNPSELKIKPKDIWIFAGLGVASIVFFNYCYFSAVSVMSLSAAAVLLYTSPIFVMIMSALFFKEKLTRRKIVSVLVSFAGIVFVTGVTGSGTRVSAEGILLGIGSAFGYALYSIFTRAAINRGYSSLTITMWAFLFAAAFSVFSADLEACTEMFRISPVMIPYTLAFSLIASVLPYILYSEGLKAAENGKAAVIASIEPVTATLYGIIFYKEIPSLFTVLGIVLVLAGIVISSTENTEKITSQ